MSAKSKEFRLRRRLEQSPEWWLPHSGVKSAKQHISEIVVRRISIPAPRESLLPCAFRFHRPHFPGEKKL